MDWGAGSERPLAYRLDERGEPTPMDMNDPNRWVSGGDPFRDPRRIVAKNVVDGYEVSTVFLVIDHAFHGGAPVLWETMIFPPGWPENRAADQFCQRYTSREAAAQRHAEIVAALLAGQTPDQLSECDCD